MSSSELSPALVRAFAHALAEAAAARRPVAIPSRGTFEPVVTQERVEKMADGRCVLAPPRVDLTFIPAARLRSQITLTDEATTD